MAINLQNAFTTSGATIGASATLPATDDVAGYAALSFTNIGQVIDAGQAPSKTYNIVTTSPIDSRRVEKIKGAYDVGTANLIVNVKKNDTGQIALLTALELDVNYAFEINLNDNPTGTTSTIVYCQGLVSTAPINLGTIDNVVSMAVTIAWNTDDIIAAAT
jgi:hypothetical protein